ncbi:MAG: hypothetical protein JKX68_09155 [Flavobacteriales bacterium]|nr:hypothetical protein [Flavobacteriales bacterium]
MKKIIIAFTLILTSTFIVNAQQDTLKSRDGDWGFVLNLTGLIDNISLGNVIDGNNNNSILAKHHLTDDKVLRLGFGIKSISNSWLLEDSITVVSTGNRALQTIDSTESRFDFSISVGYEKHLGTTRRLDPFIGAEIVIGRIGATKIDASTDITDVTGTEKIQDITQIDGGFNFGLNFIAGFNYFFAERISIGAEINLGYLYSSVGGDMSHSRNITPVSGQEINDFSDSKNKSSSRGFNVNSTGGLMLSFFF